MQYIAGSCCSILRALLSQTPSLLFVHKELSTAVCCSMLQYIAVRCGIFQRVAVYHSMLQCVAVCCSVLPCVAVCCRMLQCVAVHYKGLSVAHRAQYCVSTTHFFPLIATVHFLWTDHPLGCANAGEDRKKGVSTVSPRRTSLLNVLQTIAVEVLFFCIFFLTR